MMLLLSTTTALLIVLGFHSAVVKVTVQSMVLPVFLIAGAVLFVATYRSQVAKLGL